jgi:hypothetical protein
METRFNFFRKFVLGIQKVLGNTWLLKILEHSLLRDVKNDLIAPLFIIGAPRTGSTLLYQLLIQNFNLSYFNNMQSFFYGSPALIAKLTQKFNTQKSFKQMSESNYGYIPGAYSPSESGAIFRYWFGDNDFSGAVSEPMRQFIRKTIVYFTSTFSAPFIAKNLNNALRLGSISTVFPEAIFLWIKRDPLYASQSLIKMRRKLYGSDNVWASIKPPSYVKIINAPPFEQVVHQIKEIDDTISQHLGKEIITNFIIIKYEELCKKPNLTLEIFANNYERLTGLKLQRTACQETITLKARNDKQLPESEWMRLKDAVNCITGGSN